MNKKKKIFLGAGILVVLAIIGSVITGGGTEVETVEVKTGGIAQAVIDTGYVQAASDYVLQTTQNVRVVDTPVERGQAVQPGQTLVVLENLDLALQISEAQSQQAQANAAAAGAKSALERARIELADSEENLSRVQRLFEAGAASQADYDRARTQAETSRQNVLELETRLKSSQQQTASINQMLEQLDAKERQLVVKSPIAGTVLDLAVEKEQVLMPGAPLVTVGSADQLEVKTDVLSDDLRGIQAGQPVKITAPILGDDVLEGEVKKIYPQAEEKVSALGVIQRRVPVIISLKDSSVLKPGFEVRVAIQTAVRENTLVVPRESVRTVDGGQREVMVVVDGRIQHRAVQTGLNSGESIEITGGLQAGEVIVRDGSLNLEEKARVKPVSKQNGG